MISVYLGKYHYKWTNGNYATLTNLENGRSILIGDRDRYLCNSKNKWIKVIIEENQDRLD